MHRETARGTAKTLLGRYRAEEPQGEFTLMVGGAAMAAEDRSDEARNELRLRQGRGEDARTASAAVGLEYRLSRNEACRLRVAAAQAGPPRDDMP